MDASPNASSGPEGAVLIKRYANRKLYNTATSRYITLKGIADLIEDGEEIRVIDNETGEDITSVTLSQILVDTERANRRVPGTVLSDLIQRSGDVLYSALKRRVDDASEGFEEFQRNVKKLLSPRDTAPGRRSGADWVAVAAPDLDRLVQRAVERVLRALDLPRRSDLEALEKRLDQVLEQIGATAPGPRPEHPDHPCEVHEVDPPRRAQAGGGPVESVE